MSSLQASQQELLTLLTFIQGQENVLDMLQNRSDEVVKSHSDFDEIDSIHSFLKK